MSISQKDPIGAAILDYANSRISKDIIVKSDICDDDVIPSAYLFRSIDEMPDLERIALDNCTGKVLDIGAGAGVHALELVNHGLDVKCIDTSQGAVDYMSSNGLNARSCDFFSLENECFDTLLFLMNGIGIAGTLDNLEGTLSKALTHLNPGGKIIFDSSDVKYIYEDDEGGLWIDLSAEYYGNFKFQMVFENHESDWFNWLYVDFDSLQKVTDKLGLKVRKLAEENQQYLVEITKE